MSKPKRKPRSHTPSSAPHAPHVHEVVDPRWILSALGIMVVFAILCAYATLCTLFYRNQWQLAVTPSRSITATPTSLHLPFTEVHFGDDASGQPQLDGWWIPSQPTAATALVLHSGKGSMSAALPTAQLLHDAGLNVLLFDYRGFGHSGGQHPNQSLMEDDAVSALHYLTNSRSISSSQITVFGAGVGASLAVHLCAGHPELRSLILENADGDIDRQVSHDPRTRLAPVKLLFNQKFPLAAPLHTLDTPKLLITLNRGTALPVYQQAANPKVTVELPPNDDSQLEAAIRRFLTTPNQ
jgi:pimeloyl-ACP methyl ester carboxylesterase